MLRLLLYGQRPRQWMNVTACPLSTKNPDIPGMTPVVERTPGTAIWHMIWRPVRSEICVLNRWRKQDQDIPIVLLCNSNACKLSNVLRGGGRHLTNECATSREHYLFYRRDFHLSPRPIDLLTTSFGFIFEWKLNLWLWWHWRGMTVSWRLYSHVYNAWRKYLLITERNILGQLIERKKEHTYRYYSAVFHNLY
jgi:hypothetical protein